MQAPATGSGGTDGPLEEFLELRRKRRRERDDEDGDRRAAEAGCELDDEEMRDADAAAPPVAPAGDEIEVPDT
eukprot:2817639-Alexandrium_andersonii.AAC.1